MDENLFNIINYENGVLLSKAESKCLFLSFCIEFTRWVSCLEDLSTSTFVTFLPIQLDGTCNAYQHLALLTCDIKMALSTNLGESD